MRIICTPITDIQPLLSGFVPLRGQHKVNEVDAKRVHPTEKFKELADCAPFDLAYQHMYLAFAIEIPANLILEIQCFGLGIKITGYVDGFVVKGVMSASLWDWKQFLPLATHKDQSEWLIKLVTSMYAQVFIQIPYFKDLKYNNSALVKA